MNVLYSPLALVTIADLEMDLVGMNHRAIRREEVFQMTDDHRLFQGVATNLESRRHLRPWARVEVTEDESALVALWGLV